MLVRFFIFTFCLWKCLAGVALMGLGGGGGGMIKGSSFSLDTKEPRKTRVHGNSLQIDLDILEILMGGGILRYSPTHVEFEKGLSRWISKLTEEKISVHFNDKLVFQLYSPDESPYFQFSMPQGNGVFRDLLLDKSLTQKISLQLCLIESIFDTTLSVDVCQKKSTESQPTISTQLESLALSMVQISERVIGVEESMSQSLLTSLNDLYIQPLALNISSLSSNVTNSLQLLDSKIIQSSQEMATRTLNSFRNLSTTLNLNITTLRESVTQYYATQNETFTNLQNEIRAEFNNSIHTIAEMAWENITALNNFFTQLSINQKHQVITEIGSQLTEMNSSLSSLVNGTSTRFNTVEERMSQIMSSIDTSLQFLEGSLKGNATQLKSFLTFSLNELNSTLQNDIFMSESTTLSQIMIVRVGLEDNITSIKSNFSEIINDLEFSMKEIILYINSSLEALNQSLDHSNEQISLLSSNTSQAIARSNAILSRVIADVNISLTEYKNISMIYFNEMLDTFQSSLQVTQDVLRNESSTSLGLVQSELATKSQQFDEKISQLNTFLTDEIVTFKNETQIALRNIHESLDSLQIQLRDHHLLVDSKLAATNESFFQQLINTSSSFSSLLNSTTLQIRSEIQEYDSKMTMKIENITQSSGNSLTDIRNVLMTFGKLLYPAVGEEALWVPNQLPVLVDDSWYHTLNEIPKKSPVIFDLIDNRIVNLTQHSESKLFLFQNETAIKFNTIEDLINNNHISYLAALNDSSVGFIALVAALNNSLLQEKDMNANTTQRIEATLDHETNRLELLISNSSFESNRQLKDFHSQINSTLIQLKQNFTTILHGYRNHSMEENEELLARLSLVNQTLRSQTASLSTNITDLTAYLAGNITNLINLTQTNFTLLVKNQSVELAALKNMILNETLYPLERSFENRLNCIMTKIENLNSSTSTLLNQLAMNASNTFNKVAQDIATEVTRLSLNISEANQTIFDSFNAMKLNVTSNFVLTNHSIALVDARLTNLTKEFTLSHHNQSIKWEQNYANMSMISRTISNLNDSVTSKFIDANNSFTSSLTNAIFRQSKEWNETLREMNHSLVGQIHELRGMTISLNSNLNQTMATALQTVSSDLMSKQLQLESHVNRSRDELKSNFLQQDLDTRQTLSLLVNRTQQEIKNDVRAANMTLFIALSTLASNVNQSMHSSLQNVTRLLSDYSLVQDGKVAVLTHRLTTLENISTKLIDSSSSLTLETALFKAGLDQLKGISDESKRDQLQFGQSLRNVEISLGNTTTLLTMTRHDISSLRFDQEILKNQLTNLILNSSLNSIVLNHIFSAVNNSHQTTRLSLDESRNQTSLLKNEIEKEKSKTEACVSEIRNLSHLTIPILRSQIDEVRGENNKERDRLEEKMKRVETRFVEIGVVEESLGKRVATLEMEVKGLKDSEIVSLKRGVEEGRSRCDQMTGDLKKEFERSQNEKENQEKKLKEMSERLAVLETKSVYQEKRITELVEENDKMRKNLASQSAVDDLRKLIQDLQSSMLTHSNKVLDVVITKLASSNS